MENIPHAAREPLPSIPNRSQEIKVPFGERDGRLYPPGNVERGLACRCICPDPECGADLVAKRSSRGLPFFAHHNRSECKRGYETALHRMAKQIIDDAKAVTLPEHSVRVQATSPEGITLTGSADFPKRHVELRDIMLERRVERWVPDLSAKLKNKANIFIEIYVSHAVDGEKPEKLDNLFEINLSKLSEEVVSDLEKLKEAVLISAPRKWYRCSLYDDLDKARQARDLLRRRLADEKIKALDKRKAQEAADKREREINQNKLRMRSYYAEELEKLEAMTSPAGIIERHEALASDPQLLTAQQWVEAKFSALGISKNHTSPLVNIPSKGDWIFNTHPLVWQAFVLFGIIFKSQPGFTLHTATVLKTIEGRYGTLPWVKTLDKLKRSQKKQGEERNQWYADEGAWFLEHEENQAIISPYRVVIEYLDALSRPQTGILSRIHNSPKFTIKLASLNDYARFQAQREEEQASRIESLIEEQAQDEYRRKQKEKEKQETRDQRDLDAKRCAVELEAALYAGASQASFCPCCRSVFTTAVTECSECGQRQIRTMELNESELETLYHRVRCSPCLDRPS
ncbi:hypothetical protein QC820_09970 [Halomonas mongoliensis]|uniref:Competence protein CoiA-like family protein n=1 Tax=Halomonas mongoliensis TaxID=321265 RepID=A0ABU1GNW7_9GAMM|nr:hypothetical protein [Halomonas mongoliensis]MDR5893143.1 hypothetical protein [Halomonas mongoliensis]